MQWYYVNDYPMNTSGKIQKYALRDMIAAKSLTPEPFVKPDSLGSAGAGREGGS